MVFFPWVDEYSVGIAEIDTQHRRLVSIINRVYADLVGTKEEQLLGPLLDELIDYAKEHFSTEEGYLERAHYPGTADHKALHAGFSAEILEVKARLDSGTRVSPLQVADFLKRWLSEHILRQDRAYGSHLLARGLT
jgi:hemerythrin-like metal-binding protein